MMKRKPKRYQIVGRDARSGRFISVAVARKRKATAIVQRIGYLVMLFMVLPVMAQTYTCQQTTSSGGFTLSCSGGALPPPPPPPPPPPVDPPTTPVGCNANAIQPRLEWGEVRQQRAQSGQVMAFPVNATEMGRASLTFTQGQQPSTAARTITEFTVSNCPGVIDPTAGACYYRGPFVNNNSLDIYTRDYGIPGACLATNAAFTYYINVRWTYPVCNFGACGFSLQWAIGPW